MFIDHLDGDKQNNRISNLRIVDRKGNSQNCKIRADNTSGTKGVTLTKTVRKDGSVKSYWVAFWSENGKQIRKFFSVDKYGNTIAFEMATLCREKAIEKLNSLGSQYTIRHIQS